jgi:hypothetical protein
LDQASPYKNETATDEVIKKAKILGQQMSVKFCTQKLGFCSTK